MKKLTTLLTLALLAVVGMQAQDPIWVLGNVGEQGWDPSVGTQMTYQEDEGTYYLLAHFNTSSYFSFTSQLASSSSAWDEIKPYRFGAMSNNFVVDGLLDEPIACGELGVSSDNAFLIETEADYEITLMIDGEDRLVMFHMIPGTDVPDIPEPDGNVYILGTVNGGSWVTNAGVKMVNDPANTNIFTADIFVADSTGTFSFTKALAKTNANWSGIQPYRFCALEGQDEVILDQVLPVGPDGIGDPAFTIAQGNYKFTLDTLNRTLVVVAAELDDAMYIIGNDPFGGWDPANPMKMTKKGDVYEAEAEINGDVWFIFSDAFGSWDAVNARRFGPESTEEDQTIAVDEEVTTQLSTSGKSYKVTGNGTYTITFDKTNLVFKFATKGGVYGDVDGNGIVDTADLAIVIDAILGLNDNPAADVDGNGIVDTTDMALVIDIILGN